MPVNKCTYLSGKQEIILVSRALDNFLLSRFITKSSSQKTNYAHVFNQTVSLTIEEISVYNKGNLSFEILTLIRNSSPYLSCNYIIRLQ